jgi:hypothetical protein
MNIKRNTEELEALISSLNNKLKIANSEIHKLHTVNVGSSSLRNSHAGSPIKIRAQDSIASRMTPIQHGNSVMNSPLKLTKKPFSVASDHLQAVKSKSSFFEGNTTNNNNPDLRLTMKEDDQEKLLLDEKNASTAATDYFGKITRSETLKEKVDNLQGENKQLQEKLIKFEDQIKVEPMLEKIAETIKFSVKHYEELSEKFNESQKSLNLAENKLLKDQLIKLESENWNESIKNIKLNENLIIVQSFLI